MRTWEGWEDREQSEKMYVSKYFKEKREKLISKQHYRIINTILPGPQMNSRPRAPVQPRETLRLPASLSVQLRGPRGSGGGLSALLTCLATVQSQQALEAKVTGFCPAAVCRVMPRIQHVDGNAQTTSV